MKNKPKLLICIDWYTPAFKAGGPIRSVTNLVSAIEKDYDIYILTSAYDLGDTSPYENVSLNEWVPISNHHVKYLDRKHQSRASIKSNIELIEPDFVYTNSLFSKYFSLIPISIAKKMKNKKPKVIIAPRGMMGAGALAIKSKKKKYFLKYCKFTGLFKNVHWHATSIEEKKEILKFFPNASVSNPIPNLPKKVGNDIKKVIDKKQNFDSIRICFVSRLSKKKNLEFAIKLLNKINFQKPVEFNVYGEFEEDDYQKEIQKIKINQPFLKVNYKGFCHPDDVFKIFKSHHLHFLPTQNENYGHAIVESWAYGCPVLISDNTPWRNLESELVGWDISLDKPEKFEAAIYELLKMDTLTYNKWVASCFQFYRSFVVQKEHVDLYRKELFAK